MIYTVIEFHIFAFHTNIIQANREGNNKSKTLPTTIFKHSQSQNRSIRAVLLVAFRRVPVCISFADMYLYLHLLLSVHLTCPLEAPPCLPIPCCNYKGGCNKDTSGLWSQLSSQFHKEGNPVPPFRESIFCTVERREWHPQQIDWLVSRTRIKALAPTKMLQSSASRIMTLCGNSVWRVDACLRTTAFQLTTNHWATMTWDRTHPRPGEWFGKDRQ